MINFKRAIYLLFYNRVGFTTTLFTRLSKSRVLNVLGDVAYVKFAYWCCFGERLNLNNPTSYNEKLQWLKIYDHNPNYIQFVDKYQVKQYISQKIGSQYVIPTLGHWNTVDEIDITNLPDSFVLKWNHDSGSIVICKDKSTFDLSAAKNKLRRGEKCSGYWYGREWPYKAVKPLVFAEQYMEDEVTGELRDYKFFCFNGEMKIMLVASDRQNKNTDTKFDFFDRDFNHLNIINVHPNATKCISRPQQFDKMIEFAESLSKGYVHMRVDFYEVNGAIYFGELTLYHGSGFMTFSPAEWYTRMGSWIDLNIV